MAAAHAPASVNPGVPMVDLRDVLLAAQESIQRNLANMYAQGQYILGPQTLAFENGFARATGGRHAVGTGSGTAAIELCLRAAGIGRSPDGSPDEVVVPAMTSLFTAQAVLAVGASLRIADVCPDTLLLTPESLRQAWTPQTRAVIAVHLYGQPCRIDEIAELCNEREIVLVQDACQAHGARYRGRPLTQFSPYSAYSFYPTKNLGALGDGGAVVTDDDGVADCVRLLRDGGRRGDQTCRMPGINSRLHELQACYLNAFLPMLPAWNTHRRSIAANYRGALAGSEVQPLRADDDSVHHLMVVRGKHRDALRKHLGTCQIQTGVHYPVPIHEQPGLRPYCSWTGELSVASLAAREILSLPIAPHVSATMAESVIRAVLEFRP
jgi:dTDP-3-amino-3,4,6-trideoxy-alpha-D-glucose transaminase